MVNLLFVDKIVRVLTPIKSIEKMNKLNYMLYKNIIQWTIDRSNYLDNQTFYISYSEIKYSYKKYF